MVDFARQIWESERVGWGWGEYVSCMTVEARSWVWGICLSSISTPLSFSRQGFFTEAEGGSFGWTGWAGSTWDQLFLFPSSGVQVVVVWKRMALIGSHIWMPGSQLVELFVTRCDLLEEVFLGVGFEVSKVHVIFSVSL